jgi:hypothetical protein
VGTGLLGVARSGEAAFHYIGPGGPVFSTAYTVGEPRIWGDRIGSVSVPFPHRGLISGWRKNLFDGVSFEWRGAAWQLQQQSYRPWRFPPPLLLLSDSQGYAVIQRQSHFNNRPPQLLLRDDGRPVAYRGTAVVGVEWSVRPDPTDEDLLAVGVIIVSRINEVAMPFNASSGSSP